MALQLSASDREVVIDYLARERAETAICHVEDYEADLGWSSDSEEFWYRVFRKEGVAHWGLLPFEEQTDEELLRHYLSWYDVNPEEHMMDAFVAVLILNAAFG